jgi:GT2 family glycosyltransferase
MAAELSIIIVNWNGGELLKSCLRSVAAAPPSVPYEIVIVDNASSDQSVAWLRSDEISDMFPIVDIDLIENTENTGFSRANNQAIALSKTPMLFLLNPDTEVKPGAIDTLITCLNSDERIGACGPRLLNTDGSLQPSVWRNPPTPWEIVVTGLGLWRLIPRRLRGDLLLGGHWHHDQRRSVPLLFGAAILAKRAMIDQVGSLDERFHMYGEDNEWCLRIIRTGWKLIFEPAAEVTHHGAQFSLQRWTSLEKLRVQMNASFQFNRYCLSKRHNIANLLATCIVSFTQKTWFRLRGRSTDAVQIIWETHVEELRRTIKGE